MSVATAPRKFAGPRNPGAPTTEKQAAFIRSLASKLGRKVMIPATTGAASDFINVLKADLAEQAPARPAAPAALSEGVYEKDDAIYRVQKSRNTDRLYAKRLVITVKTVIDENGVEQERPSGKFVYEAGCIFRLAPENRLSIEAAAARGLASGVCIVCGKELRVEKSVKAGLGPVCAKRV